MEFTKEQMDQIKGIVSEALKASNSEMTKAFDTKISEAVAPITSRIEQVEGKVKEAPKPTPSTGDPLGKGGGGGDGLNDVLASIRTLTEKVDIVVTERSAERSRSASRTLVDEVVAKKYPNLKGKSAVMKKLYAAEPKDEAALEALIEQEKNYAAEMGFDTKAFGADPSGENGKPGEGSEHATEEQKNKARADALRQRREKSASR